MGDAPTDAEEGASRKKDDDVGNWEREGRGGCLYSVGCSAEESGPRHRLARVRVIA